MDANTTFFINFTINNFKPYTFLILLYAYVKPLSRESFREKKKLYTKLHLKKRLPVKKNKKN